MYMLVVFQLQAVAGLAADGRQIVARAKSEATNYERSALLLWSVYLWSYLSLPLALKSFIYFS